MSSREHLVMAAPQTAPGVPLEAAAPAPLPTEALPAYPAYPSPESALPAPAEQIKPSRLKKWGMRLAGGVLATSAALGLAGERYADDPLLVPELAAGYFYDYGTEKVPQATLDKINQIVDRPASPELKAILDPPETQSNLGDEYGSTPGYDAFVLKAAKEHGLTAIDPKPYREMISKASSAQEVTEAVNQYTQQLGFAFNIHETTDYSDIGTGIYPADGSTIDLAKFKEGSNAMLGALLYTTKEFHEVADVREIRIINSLGKSTGMNGKFTPSGKANSVTGILYIPLEDLYEGRFRLFMHEISHRTDYKLKGPWGMLRDAELAALNPDDFTYGDRTNPRLKETTVRTYGGTNPLEDKATMYEGMINGLSVKLLYHESPVIRSKYRNLLGRLEVKVPGITEYLFAISGGTDLFKDESKDCEAFAVDPSASKC